MDVLLFFLAIVASCGIAFALPFIVLIPVSNISAGEVLLSSIAAWWLTLFSSLVDLYN